MGIRKVWIVLVVALFLLLVPNVPAQENEVCLVYFTGYSCGDECGLTDTLMDGLINEYSNSLTAIRYYVDASQENANVFQAYRRTYNLPSSIPMVLFGKDDYLAGKDSIYSNTEEKIFGFLKQNGTNCPLDSGYVPPSSLNPESLPGQADVFESQGGEENAEEEDNGDGAAEVIPTEEGGVNILSLIENAVRSDYFPESMMAAAAFVIIIVVVLVAFRIKK
jgi:hypothetical protein